MYALQINKLSICKIIVRKAIFLTLFFLFFCPTFGEYFSQAVKELGTREKGKKAIVSVCADGGLGTVMLLES